MPEFLHGTNGPCSGQEKRYNRILLLQEHADMLAEQIGFGILASVPQSGNVYPLLGRPHDSLLPNRNGDGYNVSFCTYLGATFDASTTNLTYHIPAPESSETSQPMEVVISFLSPITPTSTLRQSIPASYITVHVSGSFNVDIYLDINGQWASGDRGANLAWDFEEHEFAEGKGLKSWKVRRANELLLSEIRDQAEWGTVHFTAPIVWDFASPRFSIADIFLGCPP